jgi:hypothetical protein
MYFSLIGDGVLVESHLTEALVVETFPEMPLVKTDLGIRPDPVIDVSTLVNGGIGWYEFFSQSAGTTHIAHIGESGYMYTPDSSPAEFLIACSRGEVHQLVRVSDVKEMKNG